MPLTTKRYRCRTCGELVNDWLPWAKRPFGPLLLAHLSHAHPDQARVVLDQLTNTDQLGEVVAAVGYELIKIEDSPADPQGERGQ